MIEKRTYVVPGTRKVEFSPVRHRSTIGVEFWYDFEKRQIKTSNPEVSLHFVGNGGREPQNFIFLRMRNLCMQLGQKGGRSFPISTYRGPKEKSVWVIGALGVPLYRDKSYRSYRSLGDFQFKITDGFEPVAVDCHFVSKKQQDEAVTFISQALSKYDGNWIGAYWGKEQSADVHWRPELIRQLENGDLIKR